MSDWSCAHCHTATHRTRVGCCVLAKARSMATVTSVREKIRRRCGGRRRQSFSARRVARRCETPDGHDCGHVALVLAGPWPCGGRLLFLRPERSAPPSRPSPSIFCTSNAHSRPMAAHPKAIPLVAPGHTRPVTHLSFSPLQDDGTYVLISSCKDGNPMLREWTGDWIGTFIGHKGAVWSSKLSPDTSRAASGSADFTA